MKLTHRLLAAACAVAFAAGTLSSAHAAMSRKPKDNLFFATSTEILGLDPALVDDSDSGTMIVNIYESLLKFANDSSAIEPSLAESWKISDDGLVYTFYLRKGVKFHDGTDFNAEAVRFNFERQTPENQIAKMSYAPLVFADVKSFRVVDEHTFEVTLKRPSTPFLRNMAMAFAAPIVSPAALKKHNNDVMEHPCGTGPYKLLAWDKGQQVILTRNEDYWGEKPAVQNIFYRLMKEQSARVVALNNGEVDYIGGIDGNVIDEIKNAGNKIYEEEGNNVNYMMFNCRKGYVTADREVRRAIAQSVNVPKLVESLYKGYATPAHTFYPSFMSGYDKDLRYPEYNPEAAKKFFAERGIKELKILTYSNARLYNSVGGQVLAEAVQAYLAEVGVKAQIAVYDWGTFRTRFEDDWDVSFIGWSGDNGDPDNFINFLTTNDPVSNQGLWLNEEFNKLVEQGMGTPEGEERAAIYRKADAVIAEDVGVLPISHAKLLMAYRPNISGDSAHPLGFVFFNRAVKEAH